MSKALFPALFLFFIVAYSASCSSDKTPQACNDPLGCVRIEKNAPVHLGVIETLSGRVAVIGREQVRGLELALARRGDTILGHPVKLTLEDTGCRSEGGHIAALKLVSDPTVVALFGTTCSSAAASAAKVMSQAGVTMISGNNSAPFLTSIGGEKAPHWQPGFFRTSRNEEHSGPAAAQCAFSVLGLRTAAVIDDGDIYTKGLADGFRREFERLGGKVVARVTVNKGDNDMAPALEAVAASKADLLFFPLFSPEGNHVLRQAKRMPQLAKTTLMSDGSLMTQSFIDDMGTDAVGMYFVGPTPAVTSDATRRFESEYIARYGQPPSTNFILSAFDAANLLLDAIEKVAVKQKDGSVIIGRQALRDALYATRNHPGVNETTLNCDQFGDCASPAFNVLRLTDPAGGLDGLEANVVYRYAP
ncbi:hypothetical protein JCM15519_01460 [Fundidesulfovibrio butyratiphilus]